MGQGDERGPIRFGLRSIPFETKSGANRAALLTARPFHDAGLHLARLVTIGPATLIKVAKGLL